MDALFVYTSLWSWTDQSYTLYTNVNIDNVHLKTQRRKYSLKHTYTYHTYIFYIYIDQ